MTDHTHFDAIGVVHDNREWRDLTCEEAIEIFDAADLRETGGRSDARNGEVAGYDYYVYSEWSRAEHDALRTFIAPGICVHQVLETTTHIETEEN